MRLLKPLSWRTAAVAGLLVAAADALGDVRDCGARCYSIFSPGSAARSTCEQMCAIMFVQPGPMAEACREELLGASFEHLNLLSYSSGHILEAIAILKGALSGDNTTTSPADAAFLAEFHVIDRGSPAACADVPGAHYCLGQAPMVASLGLCLPQSCDRHFVEGIMKALTTPPDIPVVGGSSSSEKRGAARAFGATEKPSLSFSCGDELRVHVDAGTVAVFCLIGTLLALVAAGTTIDYNHRKQKQQQQLKLLQQDTRRHGLDRDDKHNTTTTTTTAARRPRNSTSGGGGASSSAAAHSAPATSAWVSQNGGGTEDESKVNGGGSSQQQQNKSEDTFVTHQGELLSTNDSSTIRQPLLASGGAGSGGGATAASGSSTVSSADSWLSWYLAGLRKPLLPPAETAVSAAVDGNGDEVEEGNYNASGQIQDTHGDKAMAQRQWWWRCGRWCGEHLECFSLMVNTDSLLAPPRAGDEFPALDGVRTFSMLWVVLGHTFSYNVTGDGPGFSNTIQVVPQNGDGLLSRWTAQVIPGGFLAVDTFFLMSGFLLSSVLLPKLENGSLGNGNTGAMRWLWIGKAYIHRYLRLTPTLAFVMLMFWKILPLLGDGPGWWPVAAATAESCSKYWWAEVTYLTSIAPWPPLSDGCTRVSWYLSNDTIFFIFGVPLIALYHRRPGLSVKIALGVAASSCLFTLLVYGFYDDVRFPYLVSNQDEKGWNTAYASPWARCAPYVVGVLCGMVWHTEFRGRVPTARRDGEAPEADTGTRVRNPLERYGAMGPRVTSPVVVVGIISACLLALPVYGTYWAYQDATNSYIPAWVDHCYLAFARAAWALGVALMCLLCFCGHGGFVNWVLTRPGWTTPSRLTYCAYLFHTGLLKVLYGSRDLAVELTGLEYAVTYMGVVLGTFAGATALHLLVEAPFRNLESMGRRQKQKRQRAREGK